LSPLFPSKS